MLNLILMLLVVLILMSFYVCEKFDLEEEEMVSKNQIIQKRGSRF